MKKQKTAVIASILVIVLIFIVAQVLEYRNDSKYIRTFLPVVDNATYRVECSSCHFLYLPGLLPAGSWKIVIDGLNDHFGYNFVLSDSVKDELAAYLIANAAETTGAKRSGRILDSLNGATPIRITETPYIKRKHQSIIKRLNRPF